MDVKMMQDPKEEEVMNEMNVEIENLPQEGEQEIETNPKKKINVFQLVILILVVAACIGITIYLFPIVRRMNSDPEFQQEFIAKIRSYGVGGAVVILFGFILQTVLAVIPTAPFEMVAGMMYGTWGGALLSLLGCTLGALVVIIFVRIFGEKFVKKLINIEDKKKFKFVDDAKRTEVIIFSILFMPGIPKDFICFLVPFTKVKTYRFLIINIVARIPSTFISVYFGDSLLTGNFKTAVILFAVAAVISVLGIVFNKQIVSFINRKSEKEVN